MSFDYNITDIRGNTILYNGSIGTVVWMLTAKNDGGWWYRYCYLLVVTKSLCLSYKRDTLTPSSFHILGMA